MATKPKTPKRKTAKSAKKASKPVQRSAAVVSDAVVLPSPRPPDNVIFVTDHGQVVVATSAGQVSIVTDETLAAALKAALAERQQAGLELTAMLEDAGFFVIAGSTTSHGGAGGP